MTGEVCATGEFSRSHPFMKWMTKAWVDKTLAIAAVFPFIYPILKHFSQHWTVGDVLYLAQVLLLVATMITRRTPVRVTSNPLYWLLAFVATYWGLFVLSVSQKGRPLVPGWVVAPIYFFSVFMVFWARLSLGKNIGMLPAQREIVDLGAYRWMRHPIYGSFFILMVAEVLQTYSPRNLVLYSLAVFWFAIKSLVEEEFLRKDPKYEAYMGRVRWRWIPGLV